MRIFISGTGTNIGKTVICSWLCLQTRYSYFKPIQTGVSEGRDTDVVSILSGVKTHEEIFSYDQPLSPHLAALLEKREIDVDKIVVAHDKVIIEGAGGLLVPINQRYMMVDLIQKLNAQVIIVASSELGTINHTLLTLEALKHRKIPVLGVIMNGKLNQQNSDSIEFFGRTSILAQFPWLQSMNKEALLQIPLTSKLKQIFTQ